MKEEGCGCERERERERDCAQLSSPLHRVCFSLLLLFLHLFYTECLHFAQGTLFRCLVLVLVLSRLLHFSLSCVSLSPSLDVIRSAVDVTECYNHFSLEQVHR